MQGADKKRFMELMTGIAEMFERNVSNALLKAYFNALSPYTIQQVETAVNMHVTDPDAGQWMPKPADIIRHITGSQKDREQEIESIAQMQWSNVLMAIRRTGSARTPKFKDPYTQAIISTWGWVDTCALTQEKLTWKAKEFVRTYSDYQTRPIEYLPDHIAGQEDIQNLKMDNKPMLTNLGEQMLDVGLPDCRHGKH